MSNNLLPMLGLVKKAGRLEVGEEPVGAAARAGQAKLIIVAADAAENTRRRASHFADAGRVKWISVPFTKAEMGGVLGRTTCAMAAFTDTGFAASLLKKLAAADPEQYGDAAAQLDTKAQKVLQRQKEQRAHEKNVREGKRKPWAAPAKGNPRPLRRTEGERGGTGAPAGGGREQRDTCSAEHVRPRKPWAAPAKPAAQSAPAPAASAGRDDPSRRPLRPKGKITITKKK